MNDVAQIFIAFDVLVAIVLTFVHFRDSARAEAEAAGERDAPPVAAVDPALASWGQKIDRCVSSIERLDKEQKDLRQTVNDGLIGSSFKR